MSATDMPTTAPSWDRFQQFSLRCTDLDLRLDLSRMPLDEAWLAQQQASIDEAFVAMTDLEGGAIANPDEGRMVGHYWLRDPDLAPTEELKTEIRVALDQVRAFGDAFRKGDVLAANGAPFTDLLVIGIGGSALGPQLVADALLAPDAAVKVHFFDNTDPGGIDRTLAIIGERLAQTLTVVISKSGGTKETRNGMLEAEHAYQAAGLAFAAHAVAVTGPGSQLDQHAEAQGWLKRFPMADWIGGRTSVMSVVGLVPFAILGIDIEAFLEGARLMDAHTRQAERERNPAMQMALAWYQVGRGKGEKDMVVLPYSDHLLLFSKYLQQLVMESLGKELDLDGKVVNQGIAVYGNKGSTDQHAYVQQLRDGVANFFATFVEVRRTRPSEEGIEVDPGITSADYLQGFLRGTREALSGNGRPSITLSIPQVDARQLGALIALFERCVGFYATLVNINAYHQPGVEAGKKAAGEFLELMTRVRETVEGKAGEALGAEAVAQSLGVDPEPVYHALVHLAATRSRFTMDAGEGPDSDRFRFQG